MKTNNGPGYLVHSTQVFLQRWNIQHKTGIPYNPTGQAIVEQAHHTFKNLLKKQKRGSHESSPPKFDYVSHVYLYFSNCDESLCTPIEKHFQTKKSKPPYPQVLYRDLLGAGSWQGPPDLLTWGRGYTCVSIPMGPVWLPAKRIKPYHEQNRHQAPIPGGENQSTYRPHDPADPEQPAGTRTPRASLTGLGPSMDEEDGAFPNDRG